MQFLLRIVVLVFLASNNTKPAASIVQEAKRRLMQCIYVFL